ncbi:MAG: hypothetical protein KDB14_33920 [Planctomycetales bacterium]|nr:hypothetical protein [Planctomycetales bacterium]
MGYHYWFYDHQYAYNTWDAWLAVALVVVAVALHGVWRLWRGMRLDNFERSVRALRHSSSARLTMPATARPAPQRGWLNVSLLPLMLWSAGLSFLLAQAQQPDKLSRPVTWALFVIVGSWYGTSFWSHRRGVGPLRNRALAGVLGAGSMSLLVWSFYMAVDAWRGDAGYERLTAGVPTLLWWVAVGGVFGSLIGSLRANRIYGRVHIAPAAIAPPHSGDDAAAPIALPRIVATPRTRGRVAVGAIAMAASASLLFHLSAAPQLNRVVHVRQWYQWDWDRYHYDRPSLQLTMAPANAPLRYAEAAIIQQQSSAVTLLRTYDQTAQVILTTPNPAFSEIAGQLVQTEEEEVEVPTAYLLTKTVVRGEPIAGNLQPVVLAQVQVNPSGQVVLDKRDWEGKVASRTLPANSILLATDLVTPMAVTESIIGEPLEQSGPLPDPLVRGDNALAQNAGVDAAMRPGTGPGPDVLDGAQANDPFNALFNGPVNDILVSELMVDGIPMTSKPPLMDAGAAQAFDGPAPQQGAAPAPTPAQTGELLDERGLDLPSGNLNLRYEIPPSLLAQTQNRSVQVGEPPPSAQVLAIPTTELAETLTLGRTVERMSPFSESIPNADLPVQADSAIPTTDLTVAIEKTPIQRSAPVQRYGPFSESIPNTGPPQQAEAPQQAQLPQQVEPPNGAGINAPAPALVNPSPAAPIYGDDPDEQQPAEWTRLAGKLIAQQDADGNGRLSASEYRSPKADGPSFAQLDVDGDGFLTVAELEPLYLPKSGGGLGGGGGGFF